MNNNSQANHVLDPQGQMFDNQISNFIEGIRIQSAVVDARKTTPGGKAGTSSDPMDQDVASGKEKATQLILQAEQYKAAVNNPPGTINDLNHVLLQNREQNEERNEICGIQLNNNFNAGAVKLDQDDEFFHVTCHLDPGLRAKIQKGDFVELEKLLPRTKGRNSNTGRMDLVFREGRSYFMPAEPEFRISNVRKWEQAFRVYAAVYSEANPTRAAEIWQYVHIINVAAGAYSWDNVNNYDVTFRQLMAANPCRSWAKIYQQMWSLSMRDPLPKLFTGNGNGARANNNNNYQQARGNGSDDKPTKKPKYCWSFNRGRCKDGPKCIYINRCSFCDSGTHGKNNCEKRKNSNGN